VTFGRISSPLGKINEADESRQTPAKTRERLKKITGRMSQLLRSFEESYAPPELMEARPVQNAAHDRKQSIYMSIWNGLDAMFCRTLLVVVASKQHKLTTVRC
jgi:hypothetical protein